MPGDKNYLIKTDSGRPHTYYVKGLDTQLGNQINSGGVVVDWVDGITGPSSLVAKAVPPSQNFPGDSTTVARSVQMTDVGGKAIRVTSYQSVDASVGLPPAFFSTTSHNGYAKLYRNNAGAIITADGTTVGVDPYGDAIHDRVEFEASIWYIADDPTTTAPTGLGSNVGTFTVLAYDPAKVKIHMPTVRAHQVGSSTLWYVVRLYEWRNNYQSTSMSAWITHTLNDDNTVQLNDPR